MVIVTLIWSTQLKFLPVATYPCYNDNASDNSNDALKETKETWDKLHGFSIAKNTVEKVVLE